eukprot:TRINITY_DN19563_c0_g1_i1.p1 TRINITY_DN19563_c0_g1~~TRINITY_DN19563_c0_g1_i1.p1  ORF type:complete len:240 (+),score=46.42 TRINITY_DN19563_c0_g1_i1:2-721(+)
MIQRVSSITPQDFTNLFFKPKVPVIITGAIDHWPAVHRWRDLREFGRRRSNIAVPIEMGGAYNTPKFKQAMVPLGAYIESFINDDQDETKFQPYMAQFDLLDEVPELKDDIITPDYINVEDCALERCNMWIGPRGTITPLHRDPQHNIFAQIVGSKRFRLYNPSDEAKLYPGSGTLKNTTRISNIETPSDSDRKLYPEFAKATPIEGIVNEKELLFIPRGWWHHVRSLQPSISVNFWFL